MYKKQKFKSGDINLGVAADSTWNESTEAIELYIASLATADSSLNVVSNRYNVTNQSYDAPITIQAGTSPAPGILFQDTFTRTAPELYGTTPDLGAVWGRDGTFALGDYSIDGNSAVSSSDTTSGVLIADGFQSGALKATANITCSTLARGTATQWRMVYLIKDTVNYNAWVQLSVGTSGGTNAYLFKRINGTATQVGTIATPVTQNVASVTFDASISLSGNQLVGVVNGQTMTATLSQTEVDSFAGFTMSGIGKGDAGDKVNDFKLELLSNTPPRKLTLWNGAVSGSTLAYQQSRLDILYPVPLDTLLINSSHNYGSNDSVTYEKAIDSFIADFRAKQPKAGIVISSQNPEKPPSANRAQHFTRQVNLRAYCARRGYGYIAAAESFYAQTNNGLDMVNSDGIHPNSTGSILWKDAIAAYFNSL